MTDAVKKDGPSAGVTITMSVLSCMLEKPLPNVAFTGSVDLYGNVGPVGGVFEKCIAAERTRVEKVIIPSECYKRLVDKKEIDRLNVEIVPVDTIDEVIMRVWDEGMEVLA
jgi:ATP-dependent Lon protease